MLGSGRYHHATRAARAGTPVRSRFCKAAGGLSSGLIANCTTTVFPIYFASGAPSHD